MALGIANRTENWKTARSLSPLFGEGAVLLARRLGEPGTTAPRDVTLELFWKGARDYCVGGDRLQREERLVRSCRTLFGDLREEVEAFDGFRTLRDHNYDLLVPDLNRRLANNLLNTEIDIVLQTPNRLYIGEAKYSSGFHADGSLVLVHQLVRQYVTATVLVDVADAGREVVPFVVTAKIPRSDQVRFMVDRGWMDEGNCLTWDDVAALVCGQAGAAPERDPEQAE